MGVSLSLPLGRWRALAGELSSVWGFLHSQVPHRCPVVTKSIPEVHLAVPGPPRAVPAGDPMLEEKQKLHGAGDTGQPLPLSDGGIHVYAHQRGRQTARPVPASEEVCEVLEGHKVALGCLFLMKGESDCKVHAGVSVTFTESKVPLSNKQFFHQHPTCLDRGTVHSNVVTLSHRFVQVCTGRALGLMPSHR